MLFFHPYSKILLKIFRYLLHLKRDFRFYPIPNFHLDLLNVLDFLYNKHIQKD